ncbi:hypothetical protein FSARC_11567 [Fusarium sarcochroum]|uniref:Zn(2)-C6 fungal-type domain-containing protein n=1 Tax=Fusarium sarcochroum TaxID=1208366 RepID=A0A8H4X0G0_9HYPO|nr:hypothetical protein FSARC_11567 [Fusarium sarcochroum]
MGESSYHPYREPPSPVLSDILRELDPDAPPAAPPDLLSIVSSLFSQRRKRLRQERLARENEAIEAKLAAIREARANAKDEKEKGQKCLLPPLRVKDMQPSKDEIEALIDDEVAQEAKSIGLKRAKGETKKQYNKRMAALEERVDHLAAFEHSRKQEAPLQYVDGIPVNLIEVHHNVRPYIPIAGAARFACLQCKAKGRRCSRNSNKSPLCERCARHGEQCLVKKWAWQDDNEEKMWRFAKGQRRGVLDPLVKDWLKKLEMKGKCEGIQPMPAWHENDSPENLRDQEYTPLTWQDKLQNINVKGQEEEGKVSS